MQRSRAGSLFRVNARGNAIAGVNISRVTATIEVRGLYVRAAECLGNHYPRRFIGRGPSARGREVTYARPLSARRCAYVRYVLDVSIIASANRRAYPPPSTLRSTSTSAIAIAASRGPREPDFPDREMDPDRVYAT